MKLYKNCAKESYSFLENVQLYHQMIHYNLRRTYYKWESSKKIKAIDNKTEKNKGEYYLGRQTTKISALLPGNGSKYEFLTGKDVLPEKDSLEKAAALKRFEYSPFGKKLKA